MKITLPDPYKKDFNILYDKYRNEVFDKLEVSDHWISFGNKTTLNKSDDEKYVFINPVGFDDYKISSLFNNLISIPTKIYLSKYKKDLSELVYNRMYLAAKIQTRVFSFNCIKHALSINKLIKNGVNLNDSKVAIIGDGNGFLGILLKLLFPNIRLVHINLGKILLFDYLFTSKSNLFKNMKVVYSNADYNHNSECYLIPSDIVTKINIKDIDFFFNIASMQEMKPNIIKKYFNLMRSQNTKKTFFYCCNRINKLLPDGTISDFDNYDWSKNDRVIFDENCYWYNEAPMSRPPFIKKFDGPHKHKYVELEK